MAVLKAVWGRSTVTMLLFGQITLAIPVDAQHNVPGTGPDTSGMADTVQSGAVPRPDMPSKKPSVSSGSITADTISPSLPVSADSSLPELRKKVVKHKASAIHRRKKISRQRLDRLQIQKVPAVQGDPIRAINTLPGISTQSDATVKPYIRGGKADETRVFWNKLPLMQPYHFGGLYSLFNVESIEDIEIYSGAFPVEGNNAMSGAIFLRSRPAPLDSFRLAVDLSVTRGNFYIGVPVIKNRLGVYASYQAFWYDWAIYRIMDIIDLLIDDKSFTKYKKDYKKYIDLPNFRDLQFGAALKITDNIHSSYTGLISRDIFTNLWERKAYYVEDREVSPEYFEQHFLYGGAPGNTRTYANILDSLAVVRVDNGIHNLNLTWYAGRHWVWENAAALQRQNWHVEFFQGREWENDHEWPGEFQGRRIRNSEGFKFILERSLTNLKSGLTYHGLKGHIFNAGLTYDYLEEKFDANMLRVIFELIYNGNTDLLSSLGHYNSEGFTITRDTPASDPNIEYISRLMQQINFQHKGKVYGSFYGLYAEDTWNFNSKQRLITGLRLEYEDNSEDLFPSPRLSYFHNLDASNEITFATGLYSQNDMPFHVRQTNPELQSEKSWHINSEWTHHFSKHYRFEWQNYYKFYWNLITPDMYNTRKLNWGDDGIGMLDSASFTQLPAAQQEAFIDLFGEQAFRYENTGMGNALGSELSFFYDPYPAWNGWISAELSLSKRKDRKGTGWYPFRYHRPWIINWVNYFDFPDSPYELAIRARFSSGLPYTDFKSEFEETSDTLVYFGPKNEEHYMAYRRVDIRLTRSATFFGQPYQQYFAVWNFFNRPNFMLRDRRSEVVKFFNFNIPYPILFFGITYRW